MHVAWMSGLSAPSALNVLKPMKTGDLPSLAALMYPAQALSAPVAGMVPAKIWAT
jgi:hypothetical protein